MHHNPSTALLLRCHTCTTHPPSRRHKTFPAALCVFALAAWMPLFTGGLRSSNHSTLKPQARVVAAAQRELRARKAVSAGFSDPGNEPYVNRIYAAFRHDAPRVTYPLPSSPSIRTFPFPIFPVYPLFPPRWIDSLKPFSADILDPSMLVAPSTRMWDVHGVMRQLIFTTPRPIYHPFQHAAAGAPNERTKNTHGAARVSQHKTKKTRAHEQHKPSLGGVHLCRQRG